MLFYYLYRLLLTFGIFLGLAGYYFYLSIISIFGDFHKETRLAVCLRRSFEFLGATYIKLGQIMSMRPDYFSTEICNELYKLFDRARPEPFERIRDLLKERLGPKFDSIASIEPVPIGSASFAQVHKAVLNDGRDVAIKVQRPGVGGKVAADLFFLRMIIGLIDLSTVFSYIKLMPFYVDFSKWTNDELNYTVESGNALRLLKNTKTESDRFRIPAIIWELSGSKVITMEVFEGVWLSDVFTGKATIPDNFNAADTATGIVQLFLRQIFIDGFFHADPHPGNIILLPNGQIGLIDFGIIGVMNSEFKRNMMELLSKISERDTEGAFHAVVKIVKPPKDVDLGKLQKEYEDNLNTWYNGLDIPTLDFHEKTATSLLLSNIVSLQRNKITLPNVVAQFYRCIILLESVALSLNPDKSIFSELEFFFDAYREDIRRKIFSFSGLWKIVQSYQKMFMYLPGKLESLLNKFTQDALEVRPYVDNIFKAFLAFLNILSFCLFVAVIALLFMRLVRPSSMQEIRGWNTFLVILFVFMGGLVARFLRRYISIEFR